MPICSGGHQELGGEGDQALSHTRRASAPEIPGEVCKGRSSQISNPKAAVQRAEGWAQGRRALTVTHAFVSAAGPPCAFNEHLLQAGHRARFAQPGSLS